MMLENIPKKVQVKHPQKKKRKKKGASLVEPLLTALTRGVYVEGLVGRHDCIRT